MHSNITDVEPYFTDDEVERFTCGDCWQLAITINNMYGLPIALLGVADSSDGVIGDDTEWMWVHAVNVVSQNCYLDVEGLMDSDEMCEAYALEDCQEEAPFDVEFEGVFTASHSRIMEMIDDTFDTEDVRPYASRVMSAYAADIARAREINAAS